ncbi:hypothetical protein Tco_0253225, partial [Tanacetum coccineum]
NPAQFRKFPDPFLCFVGINRYYDLDENCYPTFWANDDEGGCSFACVLWYVLFFIPDLFLLYVEMDLFDFINHVDPTKGAGDDDVNEGGDAAEANKTEQDEHVVDVGGIDVVADDEVQVIVADKPQRVRKKRKVADGASGSGLPPKKVADGASGSCKIFTPVS